MIIIVNNFYGDQWFFLFSIQWLLPFPRITRPLLKNNLFIYTCIQFFEKYHCILYSTRTRTRKSGRNFERNCQDRALRLALLLKYRTIKLSFKFRANQCSAKAKITIQQFFSSRPPNLEWMNKLKIEWMKKFFIDQTQQHNYRSALNNPNNIHKSLYIVLKLRVYIDGRTVTALLFKHI